MSIVNKYISSEILRYFGIVLAMVVSIYIAVDFFEKIDDFLEAHLPFSTALIFFIFKIPFIISQIIPVCILLAVLIVFGLMSKNNEIIALKSSGVSIYYLLKPVLLIGFLFSILLFFLSEVIVPITMGKANRIWLKDVRKEAAVISREKDIWIKGNRLITHIKYYNPNAKAIFGITINYFDEDFKLIKRIDAQKGIFKQGKWSFHEVMEQNFNKQDGNNSIMFYEEKEENLDFSPEDLRRVIKKSEEMNFKELFAYIQKVEAEGYDATIYRVDLHAKIAFPFVCIIMGIIGVGIAAGAKIKESLPVSIGCGLGIAFLYWVLYSFCVSLGYAGMIPSSLAAWTANLIFLCFGVFTLLNAE